MTGVGNLWNVMRCLDDIVIQVIEWQKYNTVKVKIVPVLN
jgi:hypothetical protein